MTLLDRLRSCEQGPRTLDDALARTLRRLDPSTGDEVAAAAALASLAVHAGHAAFDPGNPSQLVPGDLRWPEPGDWQRAIAASRWVSLPGVLDEEASADTPLVLEGGLIYLRRYREYERRLAGRLRALAAAAPESPDAAAIAPVLEALFPPGASDPLQALAARSALDRALLLVTGGPGTGKTTTITRLLVLLVAAAALAGREPPRIALAAPTGRAAERMAGSLREALERLRGLPGVDPAWLQALPAGASTIHRLLGTRSGSTRFRHDASNPLRHDVVVIDEASMVDLPLMCKLAEAVPGQARLVLLGDPDQLPSVEAGDVLAAICSASGDLGRDITTTDRDSASAPASPLLGHRVHLQRGYRQAESLDLAPLSQAIRSGDAAAVLALLRDGGLEGIGFQEDSTDPLACDGGALLEHWRRLAGVADPAQALAMVDQVRLLVALRHGPQGTQALNARIAERLAGPRPPAHFHGQLLLVTRNSYRHGLFNGDVGVCMDDGNGRLVAWFPGSRTDAPRPFQPGALPAHESAFAMTVHKAQGSEFDEVWLQLPAVDNRVLSRELLYTAVTRARRRLYLAGSAGVLDGALQRHVVRVSGLASRLNG